MASPGPFSRYQRRLEARLRKVLSGESSPLQDMMRYHLGWENGSTRPGSGKRSRPTLCLFACEAVGGDWGNALPAAAAIELIHNFSLIHDDIQDKSYERRNRPTVWVKWGEEQAINAGDAMYALAQLALVDLLKRDVPAEKIVTLYRIINKASLTLCNGQYLDIEFEKRLDVNTSQYMEMIDKKTACLFEAALWTGALLGTDDEQKVRSLRAFGRNLGLAFQIHNDILGIWAKEEANRESPYTDVYNRKKTLPIIYALEHANETDRGRMLDIYARDGMVARDVRRVISILNRTGARRYAERTRKKYYQQATKNLAQAGLAPEFFEQAQTLAGFLLDEG